MMFIRNNTFSDFVKRNHCQMKIFIENILRDKNDLFFDDDVFVEMSFFIQKIIEKNVFIVNAKISRVNNRNRVKITITSQNKISIIVASIIDDSENNAQRVFINNAFLIGVTLGVES